MQSLSKIFSSIKKRYFNIFRNGYSVEIKYGCKWLIDWSNNIDKKLTSKNFEDKEINFLLNKVLNLKPDYFLDIGAHAGLYSIVIKSIYPDINVISFEPDKQNRYQFYGNLFLNQLHDQVKVYNIGLSSVKSEVSFGMRSDAPGKRGGKAIKNDGSQKIKVDKLDNVIKLNKEYCVLKIDVEGHECEVVKGGEVFLKNNFCLVQVELWDKNSFSKFNKIMNNWGYSNLFNIGNSENYYFSNFISKK